MEPQSFSLTTRANRATSWREWTIDCSLEFQIISYAYEDNGTRFAELNEVRRDTAGRMDGGSSRSVENWGDFRW